MNTITISFIIILIFNIVKGHFVLKEFQQNLYNEDKRYFNWVFDNKKITLLSLDLLSLICIFGASILKNNISFILIVLAWVFYLFELFRTLSLFKMDGYQDKLIVTKKIKRLIITVSWFYIIPLIIYFNNYDYGYIALTISSFCTYFYYMIIWLAYQINRPLEGLINHYSYKNAKEKVESIRGLRVVGITGTYGKTSTRHIINSVLSEHFVCQAIPKNLNTITGLTNAVNTYLDDHEKVLIVEMGSHKEGEITNFCELLEPEYAILTNIEPPNISSYSSMEQAIKTKFELIESLPKKGIAILNLDDPHQVEYPVKSKCKKIWISLEQETDYSASNIIFKKDGTTFLVTEKNTKNAYEIKTRLFGRHNVRHLLASIALGREMGMTQEEIQVSITKIRPLENHLELRNFGYMTQLNNTHQSNPKGASVALEVLELMPGEKVVVTTGMQSLGEKNDEFNNIFGTQVAKVADYVILIDEKNTKSVFKGLLETGFDENKVYIVNRVSDAYTLLQEMKTEKEIYALFESDDDLKF